MERGKTWNGSDYICAFEGEIFNPNNWMCATMNELRDLVEDWGNNIYDYKHLEDEKISTIPINDISIESPHMFLVLSWYKRRGRTGFASLIDSDGQSPLTEEIAVKILESKK
jgi:hypothetical protein